MSKRVPSFDLFSCLGSAGKVISLLWLTFTPMTVEKSMAQLLLADRPLSEEEWIRIEGIEGQWRLQEGTLIDTLAAGPDEKSEYPGIIFRLAYQKPHPELEKQDAVKWINVTIDSDGINLTGRCFSYCINDVYYIVVGRLHPEFPQRLDDILTISCFALFKATISESELKLHALDGAKLEDYAKENGHFFFLAGEKAVTAKLSDEHVQTLLAANEFYFDDRPALHLKRMK